MTLSASPFYAGLLALLLVALSLRVILGRFATHVSYGDGDDKALRKRIRVQANCAEYAPLGLLLLVMTELQGAPLWVVHGLGLMLLAGRVLHAWGMSVTPQIVVLRRAGMVLTFLMLILTGLASIGHALI